MIGSNARCCVIIHRVGIPKTGIIEDLVQREAFLEGTDSAGELSFKGERGKKQSFLGDQTTQAKEGCLVSSGTGQNKYYPVGKVEPD